MMGEVSTLAGSRKECLTAGDDKFARFNYPRSIAIDGADNIYVAEMPLKNGRIPIHKITPHGHVSMVALIVSQDGYIGSLAASQDGTLYYTDTESNAIKSIDASGKVNIVAGRGYIGDARLSVLPGHLAYFTSLAVGKNGTLYATIGNAIYKIRLH